MARLGACLAVVVVSLFGGLASASPFVINEVVTDPQQDWDDGGGGNAVPFDGVPGDGPVGTGDEYVELLNVSGASASLDGRVVGMLDGSDVYECFGFTPATVPNGGSCSNTPFVQVFDSGGSRIETPDLQAIPAGAYVVIGNPSGDMLNDITVAVYDTNASVEDTVTLGTGGPNGNATTPADESVSRFPDGVDTGDDAADLRQLKATPGASNGALCAVSSVVVNEVVTDPQTDWSGSTIPFDGGDGGGTVSDVDEYVELYNGGAQQDLSGCIVQFTDGSDTELVLQDVEPASTYQISVFDHQGTRIGGAASLAAVPAGGYVVIGNPEGSMLNTITITILGDAVIDSLVVSDGNAATVLDESLSRFPNGTDTGDDAADTEALAGSPGASNGAICALVAGDLVINEAVTDPQTDWSGSGDPFDGSDGGGTVGAGDEYVELFNTSGTTVDASYCLVDFDDGATATSLIVQPVIGGGGDPQISVFDSTGIRIGAADAITAVPDGGYLVIGDPPGTMNNSIVLTLSGAGVIDGVDFGGDAPDLNADGPASEAGSRLPNGSDSGVGATDFALQWATLGASNDLDECTLGLAGCAADATCADLAVGFTCTCASGFDGDGFTCEDIDECASGASGCAVNAICTNTPGSFSCECAPGYQGDGTACTDINECQTQDVSCPDNASCANTPGGYTCLCDVGFDRVNDECVTDGREDGEGGGCSASGSKPGSAAVLLLLLGLWLCGSRRYRRRC